MDADLPSLAPEPSTLSEHGWQVQRKTGDRGYREPASEKVQITAIEGSWGRVLLRFIYGCILTSLPVPYALVETSDAALLAWLIFGLGLSLYWAARCRPRTKNVEVSDGHLHIKEGSSHRSIAVAQLIVVQLRKPQTAVLAPVRFSVVVTQDYPLKPYEVFHGLPLERAKSIAALLARELGTNWLEQPVQEHSSELWTIRIGGAVTLALMLLAGVNLWTYQQRPNQKDAEERLLQEQAILLLHDELALKSVGVKRCAARLGHLPESLVECEREIEDTREWARLLNEYRASSSPYGANLHWISVGAGLPETLDGEPENSIIYGLGLREPSIPPRTPKRAGWQDVLGMPVVYHPGVSHVEGLDKKAQFSSTEPLPSPVQDSREVKDRPAPTIAESFVLSSLAGQRMISSLQVTTIRLRFARASLGAVCALLVLGGGSLIARYRGGNLARMGFALLILCTLFIGIIWEVSSLPPPRVEGRAYHESVFWLVRPEWRVYMMIHAPEQQKVPRELREKAQLFIARIPKDE